MADQKITELPIKTSSGIATTDYLFGIDSSEGYQMLIKDLGDYIIQHVSSSLAGSNQTLAAAISALNSNSLALKNGLSIPNNADLNDYISAGTYRCASGSTAATLANTPITTGGFALVVMYTGYASGQYLVQILVCGATSMTNPAFYYRKRNVTINGASGRGFGQWMSIQAT